MGKWRKMRRKFDFGDGEKFFCKAETFLPEKSSITS
jgi:hypothetical protein